MSKNKIHTRREVIKAGALAAILPTFINATPTKEVSAKNIKIATLQDPWKGFKPGVASYSFRKMSTEQTIKAIQALGLKYVSIKDIHMPMKSTAEERRAVIQRFKDAGITPLSCGNVTMPNDEALIRNAFEYARDAGIPTIVCSPAIEALPILDRMVKEFNIKAAIHNHGPEDKLYPSPYDAWKHIEKLDKRIGVCIDVGHTARAKVDPAEAIVRCKSRLYDLHFKDINSVAPDGSTIEAGRGVLNLLSILKALSKIKYQYLLSFEFEKDGDNPVPGVAETVGYTKALIKFV
jgi:inosose dehydratase